MKVDKELREMIKAVNNYVVLITNEDQNTIKRNCQSYIADVTNLQNTVNEFINNVSSTLYIWCLYNSDNFFKDGNLIFRIKKFFKMKVANHYMNLYSYELSIAGQLLSNLDFVLKRLNQYKFLLNCY